MATNVALTAQPREKVGKGAARAVRRAGQVPAVIYGDKKDPAAIALEMRDVVKQLESGHFLTTIYEIDVNGDKTRVLPRDFQLHPVKDVPMHVDFLRVSKGAKIVVSIPVTFINEDASPGLQSGGVLNVVRHEIEVSAPMDAIPDGFELDLSGLEIGDSLNISNVTLPEGITPTITDRDFTIATIAAPTVITDDEETEGEDEDLEGVEGEEGAEGEDGEGAGEDGGESEE